MKNFETTWYRNSDVNNIKADFPFLRDTAIRFFTDKPKLLKQSGCLQPYSYNLNQRAHIFVSIGNGTKADLTFSLKKKTPF